MQKNRLFTFLLLLLALTSHHLARAAMADARNEECVIVLHGLGRTEDSMARIEQTLIQRGYRVWNEPYPSREDDIETLAARHIPLGVEFCAEGNAGAIHFVTHSMGGILVRQYLQSKRLKRLGKIVMLAPPNHGSEVVDQLMDAALFQNVMGPAGQQLSTQPHSKPNTLKPIPGTIGVIAGAVTSDPWFSWMFTGPNDGKVSVESARLDEMTDFLVVEHGHTFIMNSSDVMAQVLFFLEHGRFDRGRASPGVGPARRDRP